MHEALRPPHLPIPAAAVAGALGVAHVLKLLREELALYMAMTGCARPAAVHAAGLLAGAAGDDRC